LEGKGVAMIGVFEEGTLGTSDGFLEIGLFFSMNGSTTIFFIDAGLLLGSLSTPSIANLLPGSLSTPSVADLLLGCLSTPFTGLLLGCLSTPFTSFLTCSLLSGAEDDTCIGEFSLSKKKSTSVTLETSKDLQEPSKCPSSRTQTTSKTSKLPRPQAQRCRPEMHILHLLIYDGTKQAGFIYSKCRYSSSRLETTYILIVNKCIYMRYAVVL
jgi:hypothetical protein